MITHQQKASLLGRISVLLEIGYTLEETTGFIRAEEQTLSLISVTDQRVWDKDPLIHPGDPYYGLHRMGLLNEFDLRFLGNADNRGERAKALSQYYFWEEQHSEKENISDEHFLLSYLYRYSLSSSTGNINPVDPTLGEPHLDEMFGIALRKAFSEVILVESDAQYVDLIKSASVFDPLCMAVIEHGILRATLSEDLKVLTDYLDLCRQSI